MFVLELLGAANVAWPWWANLAAIVGGTAILLGLLALNNRMHGRPALALRPDRVGATELGIFVLLPALLPLVFGGQWKVALVTIGGNLLLLGLVYLVVGYGVWSILKWAVSRLFRQLATSFVLLMRALPLLLFFVLVLFYTAEIWQVFANLTSGILLITTTFFVALGLAFLVSRLPGEVTELESDAGDPSAPLDRRQRTNVGLVMFLAQALQVLTVAAAIGLFFIALGVLTMRLPVQEAWTQVGVLALGGIEFTLLGQALSLTRELVKVAGGIAAFSALYYTIAVLTDSNYRGQFLTEITESMRETFRVRDRYLELLRAREGRVEPPVPD